MHKMKQAKEQINYTPDVTGTSKEQEAPKKGDLRKQSHRSGKA